LQVGRILKRGALVGLLLLMPGIVAPADVLRVLMVGQVFPYETPVADWLESDPAFTYVVVPVRKDTGGWDRYPDAEARKYVRMYFPRTLASLTDYDFLCYVDTYFGHFTPQQVDFMFRAIRDSGLGGLTTLGGGISWVAAFRQSWESSSIGSAFPTEYIQTYDRILYVENFRITIDRSPSIPPVFKPFIGLGAEDQLGRQAADLRAKEGSTTFATLRAARGTGLPFTVAWRYGKGITWSVATDIQTDYNLWWTRWAGRDGYQYAADVFLNMVLYALDKDLPGDIMQWHRARGLFGLYQEEKSMLFVLCDFVEKFGANRQSIDKQVAKVDGIELQARELYLEQDIEGASETLEEALHGLSRVSDLAIKLKDRALLWVYVVEWAAVAGTLMASGSVVWSVMVRRRLYRATGATRVR